MITKEKFSAIHQEVSKELEEALVALRQSSPENYVLFLSSAEYLKKFDKPNSRLNPNMIDYRGDKYEDKSRIDFMSEFLNITYSFKEPISSVDNNLYRIYIETMIYVHIWESRNYLKKLYRLARLFSLHEYKWSVNISFSKKTFIENKIIKPFNNSDIKLGEIINKAYDGNIRNSFAHSNFSFESNEMIFYGNFKKEDKNSKRISLDEWSVMFSYSFCLSYLLDAFIHNHKLKLAESLGTDRVQVLLPKSNTYRSRLVEITFKNNTFRFV